MNKIIKNTIIKGEVQKHEDIIVIGALAIMVRLQKNYSPFRSIGAQQCGEVTLGECGSCSDLIWVTSGGGTASGVGLPDGDMSLSNNCDSL